MGVHHLHLLDRNTNWGHTKLQELLRMLHWILYTCVESVLYHIRYICYLHLIQIRIIHISLGHIKPTGLDVVSRRQGRDSMQYDILYSPSPLL